jgi:hypothetical protein
VTFLFVADALGSVDRALVNHCVGVRRLMAVFGEFTISTLPPTLTVESVSRP